MRFLVLVAIHNFKGFPAATVSHDAKTFVDATFPLATPCAVHRCSPFSRMCKRGVQSVYEALAVLSHA